MLNSQKNGNPIGDIKPVINCEEILNLQNKVKEIAIDEGVSRYLLEIIHQTRNDERLKLGASPRSSLMIMRCAQATAFMNNRSYVIPDDIKKIASPVLAHRLVLSNQALHSGIDKSEIIHDIISHTKVPM